VIEGALAKLKEAHKNQDLPGIDAGLAELNAAWSAASEELYKATQEAGGAPGAEANGANAGAQPNTANAQSENVTDAEFEEVK
jgi:molecular chaperone DnaK